MVDKHSIERHPLKDTDDWDRLRDDVQFCRISWPIGIEVIADDREGSGAAVD